MRILFDQGTPRPLRQFLTGHAVETSASRGWSELSNGTLINIAEREGFDLLITTDRNIRYQQNMAGRRIAVIALLSQSWPYTSANIEAIQTAIAEIRPGELREVRISARGEG